MKEGIFKKLNSAYEEINREQFITIESWKKTRDRILRENPHTKVKYSYKTKQFTIIFPLPSDMVGIKSVTLESL